MPEVVALGETMVLMNPETSGPLRYVHRFTKQIGGAESNFCIGVVRLGHTAGWISRLGDDELGRFVLHSIRGEGVDTSRVSFDSEAPTALMFKERRELGETKVYYYRRYSAASLMTPDDLDEEYIGSAKFLHLSGITPALSVSCHETVLAAMEMARKLGVKVSFDPNLRLRLWSAAEARRVLVDLMGRADIVLPGVGEAEVILGTRDPVAIADQILSLGASLVAVKLGAEGAYVADKDGNRFRSPGFTVKRVVDPVGAGDAFAAGFLVGLLRNYPLDECARLANAVGAFAVTVTGDIEGLPSNEELAEFLGESEAVDR